MMSTEKEVSSKRKAAWLWKGKTNEADVVKKRGRPEKLLQRYRRRRSCWG